MHPQQILASAAAAVIALSGAAGATPHPQPEALAQLSNTLSVVDPLLSLLAAPPPKLLRTTNPSPQCAAVNGGELQCCRATVAGDIQLVVWLAKIYGYKLNPNDINGLNCDNQLDKCPGVKVCCQVTTMSPLLSLWCQDNN
ncbi:hypothetical protein MAPG_04603 [Magnaporthiopsis poae ATCC 64411]|uniref:Hydrophobin n=1 Tax=Magnaporthiopsis poae (strain ATCC 64411 / 73-15) TaxID=644358 RepID=A0A0C4DX65_MAGP6|nr:hypothetical protein MAPG_04603 [Magnaporthiopsis poae ATCC 64411]